MGAAGAATAGHGAAGAATTGADGATRCGYGTEWAQPQLVRLQPQRAWTSDTLLCQLDLSLADWQSDQHERSTTAEIERDA